MKSIPKLCALSGRFLIAATTSTCLSPRAHAGAGGGQGLLLLPFVLLVIALAPFVLLAAGVTGVIKLASLAGNTANAQ